MPYAGPDWEACSLPQQQQGLHQPQQQQQQLPLAWGQVQQQQHRHQQQQQQTPAHFGGFSPLGPMRQQLPQPFQSPQLGPPPPVQLSSAVSWNTQPQQQAAAPPVTMPSANSAVRRLPVTTCDVLCRPDGMQV